MSSTETTIREGTFDVLLAPCAVPWLRHLGNLQGKGNPVDVLGIG